MKYVEIAELIVKDLEIDNEMRNFLQEVKSALIDLRDCRNELCNKCGEYKMRHEGACDVCRWGK